MLKDSYGSVTSADGTSIGYRMIGKGPGLILIQGAMGTATNYDELARSLAASFTVYLPDRRGRGMSPLAYDPAHTVRRDIEDLSSLVEYGGATFIFGLSSGAMIALAAASAIDREGGHLRAAIRSGRHFSPSNQAIQPACGATPIGSSSRPSRQDRQVGSKNPGLPTSVDPAVRDPTDLGSRATPRVRTLRASQRIDPGHEIRFQRCRRYGRQSGVVRGLTKRSPIARRRS